MTKNEQDVLRAHLSDVEQVLRDHGHYRYEPMDGLSHLSCSVRDVCSDLTSTRRERDALVYLQSLVRQVLNDLPSKRDWLDPQLEKELRAAVNATTPSSNHRALLDTWARNGMI